MASHCLLSVLTVLALAALPLCAQQQSRPESGRPADPNTRPLFKGEKERKGEENTRMVQGTVCDPAENPVDGAVVQLKDTKSLRVRSYITKDDGLYRFYGLSPDVDYEVKASHQGRLSDSKTVSLFDSRKQITINLKLEKKN